MSYVVKADAAAIAQVTESYITTALIAWVESFINTYFNRSDFSAGIEAASETHNISNTTETMIMTKYFPVISVTTLRDNIRSTSPTTIDALNYDVDNEAGIVVLVWNSTSSATGVTQMSYFTKGIAAVDITYSHGFASTPGEITALANMLCAKLARISYLEEQSSPGAIKKIQMGDYTEERFYDAKMTSVQMKYDKSIDEMLLNLNKWRVSV